MHILQTLRDRKLFAQFFRTPTWDNWIVFLAALFALPMSEEQLAIYRRCTGRNTAPTIPSHEAWLCIGRRGGKSFILALIAVFLACFKDWRPYLGPGEVGTVMIVAADRRQARTIMRYILGLLKSVPMLKRQIEGETQHSVTLKNSIAVEIHTASFRSTRGYTILAALLDELAFWPTDENASEPDVEVLNAIKPGMATIPEAMLLCASSPYAKRGTLWTAYKNHFGKDDDPILVWQAPTRTMNATVPQSFIDQHMAEDEARASAEYMAQFRQDLEAFVSREAVMACVSLVTFERPKQYYVTYSAFVDPAGGSGKDSFTLAIAHKDVVSQKLVVDAVREVKPPFSPEAVCSEFVGLCKAYGISKVYGDNYAGDWPKEQFGKFGISYETCPKAKSELYAYLLPLINSKRIDLLDHGKTLNQIVGLERRTAHAGRDRIDHAPGGHDDLANAIGGLAWIFSRYGSYDTQYRAFAPDYQDPDDTPPEQQQPAQPERPTCDGNWWKSMPRSQPTYSADERLRGLYQSLDFVSKSGFCR